ncbi:MAG: hypothetical protein JXJ04_15025 [Spirochaetales bacterium]|nr:hypothetical protein [Spirochaetales bacterium]
MKMTPELKHVRDKMLPGVITSTGFLGSDSRSLVDIIQADEEKAASLGLDWEEAADKLFLFLEKGKEGLGETITLENVWQVTVHEVRGFLPCPFGDGLHRKHIVEVKNPSEQILIHYSELSLHLLRTHHFLQGKGSGFRLEPGLLKKICDALPSSLSG